MALRAIKINRKLAIGKQYNYVIIYIYNYIYNVSYGYIIYNYIANITAALSYRQVLYTRSGAVDHAFN